MASLEKQDKEVYDPSARFYKPPGDLGITIDCDQWIQDPLEKEAEYFDIEEVEEEFDIIEQF